MKTNEHLAMKVSIVSIIGNIVLSVLKLSAGIIGHSHAMVSDSIHSFSDVLSTLVVMIGVKFSSKQADQKHPYGHERIECVASLILAIMLGLTGIGIGYSALEALNDPSQMVIPTHFALFAAIISILSKEAMYWYTKIAAKKINSTALLADAWHHRSDALSSIGSFVGIIGAKIGYPILDLVASILICLCIIKVAYDIFKDAISKMIDESCDENTIHQIQQQILFNHNVKRIDDLKTRMFGNRIYLDVEIAVDGNIPLTQAHLIAHDIHDTIEKDFPTVKHCMVHINPY